MHLDITGKNFLGQIQSLEILNQCSLKNQPFFSCMETARSKQKYKVNHMTENFVDFQSLNIFSVSLKGKLEKC